MDSTQNTQRQNEDRPTPVQSEDSTGTLLGETVVITPGIIGPTLGDLTGGTQGELIESIPSGGTGNTVTLNLTGVTQEATIDSITSGGIQIIFTFSDSTNLVITLTHDNIIAAADNAALGGETNATFPLVDIEIDWPAVSGKILTNSTVQCTSDFSTSAGSLQLVEPLASNISATLTIDSVDYPLGSCFLANGGGGGQTPNALLTEVAPPVITLDLQLYTTHAESIVVDLSAINIQAFADAPTLGAQSGVVAILLDTLLATLPPIAPSQNWIVNSIDFNFDTAYGPDTLAEPSVLDVHLCSHTSDIEMEVTTTVLVPFTANDGTQTSVAGVAVADGDSIKILFTLSPTTSMGLLEAYTVPQPLNNRSLHAIQFFADTDAETDYSQPSYDVEYSLDGVHWQIAYLALSMLGLTVGNGVPFRGITNYSVLFSSGLPGIITDLPAPTTEGLLCAKFVRYHLYIGEEADSATPPITALQMAREG